MNQKNRQRASGRAVAARIIAGALAIFMAGSLLLGALFSRAVVTQADIDKLKKQLSQATSEKNALKNELSGLKGDKAAVKKQITLLDEQIAKADDEIALQEELLLQLEQLIAAKEIELEDSQEAEAAQYEKSKLRIRFMAEQGANSYLSLLLSADSFADFLMRFEVVKQVSEHDARLFSELTAIKEQVAAQKASLEQDRELEKQTKAEMEQNREELERQLSEKNKAMQSILSTEAETQAAYKKMIEEEEELMEVIKKKAAELAAQNAFMGGEWLWPLSADHKEITSKYGMRTHPITGKYSLHTGVDIRAASGTKIYASNDGKVVTSGYNAAYGNYVVINHGGGYTTLYAHMKTRAVKEGDSVKRTSVIGYVGSTGYSTASHLHFEISKDGKTMNPLDKFKSITFKYV